MRNLLFLYILTLVVSCANRVTPTGGARDTLPPVVKACSPPDSSVNFSESMIRIIFDESISLNDLQNQLLISPLMAERPEVRADKKQLLISLPDSLRPNTTYLIRLGKSIVDVHEGNPLEDFQYVFSTGEYLDSLELQGTVVDGSSSGAMKTMAVMAYRDTGQAGDSLPYKNNPDYFARTNDKGGFRIGNMAPGIYRIFALEDKNGNYRCDESDGEGLAFLSDPVKLPSPTPVTLRWSALEPAAVRILRIGRQDRFCAIVTFNKPVVNVGFVDHDGKSLDSANLRWSSLKDTLWICGAAEDDSINGVLTIDGLPMDTVRVLLSPASDSRSKTSGYQLSLRSSPSFGGAETPLLLSSFHPITACSDSVSLKEDDSKPLLLRPSINEKGAGIIRIDYPWKPGSRYDLFLPPGLVKDRFGRTSDSLRLQFRVPDAETTGSLTVRLKGLQPGISYLLNYLSEKDEVVRSYALEADSIVSTAWLPPGKLRLQLIRDDDRNGRFTPGSFALKRQPEMVWEYAELITLRANWELEVLFSITEADTR